MPKFTIEEVIEAAEKNGYPWRGSGSSIYGEEPSYCVLEQTAKNLGIKGGWSVLATALENKGINADQIWMYNDNIAKSYKDAAENMKEVLTPHINKSITIRKDKLIAEK